MGIQHSGWHVESPCTLLWHLCRWAANRAWMAHNESSGHLEVLKSFSRMTEQKICGKITYIVILRAGVFVLVWNGTEMVIGVLIHPVSSSIHSASSSSMFPSKLLAANLESIFAQFVCRTSSGKNSGSPTISKSRLSFHESFWTPWFQNFSPGRCATTNWAKIDSKLAANNFDGTWMRTKRSGWMRTLGGLGPQITISVHSHTRTRNPGPSRLLCRWSLPQIFCFCHTRKAFKTSRWPLLSLWAIQALLAAHRHKCQQEGTWWTLHVTRYAGCPSRTAGVS